MKKFLLPLAVFTLMLVPSQSANAWSAGEALSYLNPLPYVGIGENKTSFSLNPFTGFKNCNPCKKVKKQECNMCTGAAAPVCPTCTRAFPKNKDCTTCKRVIMPVYEVIEEPVCPCQMKH